ncbi:MAG: hypothetical protein HKO77_05380 [Gemmatimonadetes bacterium]|nr:hypothetical protein [Gemmatimonadota bacterium]
MKRELMSVLFGAALLVPMDTEAQRGRGRADNDSPRVQKLEPIATGGRIAPRGRVSARAPYAHDRVVYSSNTRYRVPRAYRSGRWNVGYRDARIRVRFDYGRVPIFARHRPRSGGQLNPAELRRVLGHETVRRIRDSGRRAGLRGAVRGHWVDGRRHGLVLVVTMERVDVAEFIDYDRDGWIDDSYFFRHDRGRRWIGR